MAVGNLITRGGPAVASEATIGFIVTHGLAVGAPVAISQLNLNSQRLAKPTYVQWRAFLRFTGDNLP